MTRDLTLTVLVLKWQYMYKLMVGTKIRVCWVSGNTGFFFLPNFSKCILFCLLVII